MSKKTIGLNPLEEYLSAPKRPAKKAEEKVKAEELKEQPQEKQMIAPKVEVPKELEAAQPKVQQDQAPEISEGVEVDVEGQLAIKGTRVLQEKVQRPARQRITLHISSELVERVKNAVYWEPGLTVAGFAEEAFTNTISELEQERGAPFPQRKQHRLRGGRPVN